MTIEEKMFHLQTAAMEEARAEGNALIRQHEEALNSVFSQHCEEARRQSETRIKAEKVSAAQQLNMASSKAQLELKRELSGTQARLKQQLFEEVETLLQDYMKTEEYRHLLVHYIEKAASFADGEEMTIYINPSDADKKEYLEEHGNLNIPAKYKTSDGIWLGRWIYEQRRALQSGAKKPLPTEKREKLQRLGI